MFGFQMTCSCCGKINRKYIQTDIVNDVIVKCDKCNRIIIEFTPGDKVNA